VDAWFGVSGGASVMDAIRQRMIDEYQYDPGPYQDISRDQQQQGAREASASTSI
jgi:hypothetical protein